MTELQELLADEGAMMELMEQSLFGDELTPCFCRKCGGHVTDAEADNAWTGSGGNIECETCGPGTEIASVLVVAGFV